MIAATRRTNRFHSSLLTVSLAALLFSSPVIAADDTILANVDGQPITEADLAIAVQQLQQSNESFKSIPGEKQKAVAMKTLIEQRLVSAKGKIEGMDQTEDFKQRQQRFNDQLLLQATIEAFVLRKITDEDIKKRYDQEVAASPAENEVKARHILVKTEEEAKKLIIELDGGAKFEDLAAKHTTDPSGKNSGGDLGYFGTGMMVPEFEKAAFGLEIGAYTKAPVQSQFGFHIIKLEDKRAKAAPLLEQVKDQLKSTMAQENYTTFIEALRLAAKVDILDPALKAELEPKK